MGMVFVKAKQTPESIKKSGGVSLLSGAASSGRAPLHKFEKGSSSCWMDTLETCSASGRNGEKWPQGGLGY